MVCVKTWLLPPVILPSTLVILPVLALLWFGNGARAGLSALYYVELSLLTYVACFELAAMVRCCRCCLCSFAAVCHCRALGSGFLQRGVAGQVVVDLCTGFGILSHKKWALFLLLLPIVVLTIVARIFGHMAYDSDLPAGKLLYEYLYPQLLYNDGGE